MNKNYHSDHIGLIIELSKNIFSIYTCMRALDDICTRQNFDVSDYVTLEDVEFITEKLQYVLAHYMTMQHSSYDVLNHKDK